MSSLLLGAINVPNKGEQEARLESPPWHKKALRETAARHDAGEEQPIDWDAAKRELRNRADWRATAKSTAKCGEARGSQGT